jgi:hypothetical protein
MPTEVLNSTETATKPEYSHRSFELVFANFCNQYRQKIEEVAGPKARMDGRFLGLPGNASVQEMGKRLAEVTAAIGEPAQLGLEYGDEVPLKDAVILTARHLAWSTLMAGVTSRYLEKIDGYIQKERYNGRQNVRRLFNEKKAGVVLQTSYKHTIRDYFDSGLARRLGNDSPNEMSQLLEHAPYFSETERSTLVRGTALEIAAKKDLESKSEGQCKVTYGSSEEDAVGGDLVIIAPEDILFIDLKSKMPEKFAGGEASTDLDYERGYKWLEGVGEGRQAVVWAYSKEPVSGNSFTLTDERLAASLKAVAATTAIANNII